MSIFLPFSFGRRSDPPYNAFYYTGKDQTFNFIGGLTYTIYAWGAAGGVASTALGGYGAYVSGVFTPSTSGTATITIGPVGSQGAFVSHSAPTYGGGGYGPNGGANGGGRASFFVNTTPILVAAGGGGAAYDGTFSPVGGGNGGAVYSSSTFTGNGIGGSGQGGGGATSSSGGAAGNAGGSGTGPATNVGTLTLGGGGAGNAGGGGAGYYGGGGGGNYSGVGGGGGGSSYINTNYFSCISAAQGSSIPTLSSFTSGSTVYNLYNAGGYPAGVATSANTGSAMMIIIQNPATFNPTYIAGCSIWLDGADTSSNSMTFSSSSNLSVWKDKSGSSNNFSASGTVANITDGGYSVVSFPSGGVMTSANSVSVSSNSALFVVSKLTSIPNGVGRIVEFPSISSGDFAVRYNSPSNGLIGTPTVAGNNSNDFANNKYFVNGVFNPNYTLSSFSNVYTLIDSMISTGSGTSTIKLSDNVYNQYFVGNIAEFIYYPNGGLTNAQRRQVEMYLAWKWGLPTPLSTFSPTNITGLNLWLDAADTSTLLLNGSNVTQWNDKSGNGRNFYQAVTSNQPTLSNSAINSLPSVAFTVSQNIVSSSFVVSPGNNSTLFFVVQETSLANAGNSAFFTSTTNYNRLLLMNRTSATCNIVWYYNGYGYETNINAVVTPALYVMNANSSFANFYYNGTFNSQAVPTNSATVATSDTYRVGGGWIGYISEIIFFSNQLTTAQQQQVEGYLGWKWGIQSNLPSSHLSYYSPPAAQVTFTPLQISGLTTWFDAADSSTISLSSSNVTQWRDKSGNGYNAIQGTSGNQPTYSNSSVVFNGSSTYLNSTATVPGNAHTLFAVHKTSYNTSLFRFQNSTNGSVYIVFPFITGGNPHGYITSYDGSGAGSIDFQNSTLVENSSSSSFNLVEAVIASNSQQVYNAGVLQNSTTQNLSSGTSSALCIGAYGTANSEFYNGQVQEMIVYKFTLNATQRQQVEGYLAWKWGLQGNLPSTHPYYKISP